MAVTFPLPDDFAEEYERKTLASQWTWQAFQQAQSEHENALRGVARLMKRTTAMVGGRKCACGSQGCKRIHGGRGRGPRHSDE